MSTNRIDELMSLDPLDMVDDEVDEIIAHYRAQRALPASAKKASKEAGPKVGLQGLMDKLLNKAPKAAEPAVKRRAVT